MLVLLLMLLLLVLLLLVLLLLLQLLLLLLTPTSLQALVSAELASFSESMLSRLTPEAHAMVKNT